MNANDILSQLILNQITISQALLLTKSYCLQYLSVESNVWIDHEIRGYDNAMQIPAYRLLECDLYIEVFNALGNMTIQRLDTTHISAYLRDEGYESSSPEKMHVTQGLESLEELSKEGSGSLNMYLNEGLKNRILQWYNFQHAAVVEG